MIYLYLLIKNIINPSKMTNCKSVPILFIFSFFSTAIFGQTSITTDVFWSPQTYRILNDRDINNFRYTQVPLEYKSGGIALGIYSKKNGIGIETGFIYSPQGQKYDSTGINFLGSGIDSLTQIKLDYIKIPILFKYRSDTKNTSTGSGINFFVGAQVSILNDVKWKSGKTELNLYDSNFQSINLKNAYIYKPKVDLVLGLGYVYSLSEHLGVTSFIRFDYSLIDIENKDFILPSQNPFYPDNRLASSAYTLSLGIGLSYTIIGRY